MQKTKNGRIGRVGRARIERIENERIAHERIELHRYFIALGWAPMVIETEAERVYMREQALFVAGAESALEDG